MRPEEGDQSGPAAPTEPVERAEERPEGAEGQERRDEAYRQMQRARRNRVIKVILALAIAVLLIIFIVANSQEVEVNFVFATRRPRLIWVIFVCAVLGGVVGYLIGRPGKGDRVPRRERS
jgi:uncharacterized integral membrane protein